MFGEGKKKMVKMISTFERLEAFSGEKTTKALLPFETKNYLALSKSNLVDSNFPKLKTKIEENDNLMVKDRK